MREYGRIYSQFWTSPDVQALSDDGKMLALYLLSGPHTTIIGAFRLPDGYICADLDWSMERVSEGFRQLEENGFATRCRHTKWVWIAKFLEWNPPENPNQWKAANKAASHIPADCLWRAPFSEAYAELGGTAETVTGRVAEGLEQPLPEPFRTQEQEQEQEQKGAKRAARRCPADFTPDLAYARKVLPDIDAEAEAQKFRDWEFKTPRKDWPAVWRTWIANARERNSYAKRKDGGWH